jgi:hypothetical protein
MDAPIPQHDPDGDLMHGIPVLNPARLDLAYTWPVHRIGPGYRPRKPQATHLVVHRDADDEVRFTTINAVTARLLALLAGGAGLLADLRRQGILLGTG